MASNNKSKRIGFLLNGNSDWIGGVYYVLNLIKTLAKNNMADDEIQVYYFGPLSPGIQSELDKLDIKQVDMSQVNLLRKIHLKITSKHPQRVLKYAVQKHRPEVLYPFLRHSHKDNEIPTKIIYWIPDFQHKYLPQLFSNEELANRDKTFEDIAKNGKHLILSSNDAKNHFDEWYPNSQIQISILQFQSIIEQEDLLPFKSVAQKFNIESPYYIVCNQFWTHKNHITVLKAMNEIKDNGHNFEVLFTGKPHDPRDPNYFNELNAYCEKQNLKSVRFLGFIDRSEQLTLISNATAVIQPSLFEGWSTVNEDAKTLNKTIIASDIPVHREQLGKDDLHFEPQNYKQLALLLIQSKEIKNNQSLINSMRVLEYQKILRQVFE